MMLHRYLLLLKRLLKKKSYIVMLLMVPLFVFLLGLVTSQESHAFTVGLVNESSSQQVAEIVEEFLDSKGNVAYKSYPDELAAKKAVESEAISEAWIFPEDFEESIESAGKRQRVDVKVRILVTEDTVSNMLSREILCSRLYRYYSTVVFEDFMENSFELSEEKSAHAFKDAREQVANYRLKQPLFELGYVDDIKPQEQTYLAKPLRGMLGLWLMLCAIAASMYYIEDKERGLFIWWKSRIPLLSDLFYYGVMMLLPGLFVLISLYLGGLFVGLWRELVCLVLYMVAAILFATILGLLFSKKETFGMTVPIVIIVSAVFSPVFINVSQFDFVQRLVPLYYYLNSIHDLFFLWSLLKYIFIEICIALLLYLSVRRTPHL